MTVPELSGQAQQFDPARLLRVAERLDEMGSLSEEAFLTLGGQVKSYHESAREIAESAENAMRLLQDEDQENLLVKLQLLIERCSLWLEELQKQSASINDILDGVSRQLMNLQLPLAGLSRIVKTLHSLRVSTRIEATKIHGQGGAVLAQDLKQLGELIHDKTTRISDQVETLEKLNEQALAAEQVILTGPMHSARGEISLARDGLVDLTSQRLTVTDWADRLKGRTREIATRFGSLIAALQFQDITQQRLGHVRRSLTDLGSRIEEILAEGCGVMDDEACQLSANICRLQVDQLSFAKGEFLDATTSLRVNLHGMVEIVVGLVEDVRGFSGNVDTRDQGSCEAVADILHTVTGTLETVKSTHHQAGEALFEVCDAITRVATLVDEVEFLGEEMQLLSLNAAVSAAHSRGQGAGLDIIAQNIHDLAEEAFQQATNLARECHEITSRASDLGALQRSENEEEEHAVDALLAEGRSLLGSMMSNSIDLETLLGWVEGRAADLSKDVNAMTSTIVVDDEFSARMIPIIEELDGMAATGTERQNGEIQANIDDLLHELRSRYTMNSEREVHRRFVARHAPSSETDEQGARGTEPGNDNGLDDNIELF